MLGFEGRYAVFLYVMPMQTDVKVAQLVDEQQIHVGTGLFPIGLSHAHDVAGLGLGEIIAIDGYDAVVILGDGCGLVGAGGADLLSRYRGSQLRGRGNLDIGDEHIAVIHALLFQFHDDGIVPVAIFGIIGRNGRVARCKEVNGQRVHRGCGQNIAEYGAGQHGVWLGQRGFLPAFLLCIGGVQIALLRLLRDRAGGDQKCQGNRHQHRKHACGGNKGFAHRHRSFLNQITLSDQSKHWPPGVQSMQNDTLLYNSPFPYTSRDLPPRAAKVTLRLPGGAGAAERKKAGNVHFDLRFQPL